MEALPGSLSVGKQTSYSEAKLKNFRNKKYTTVEYQGFTFRVDSLRHVPQLKCRTCSRMFFFDYSPNMKYCSSSSNIVFSQGFVVSVRKFFRCSKAFENVYYVINDAARAKKMHIYLLLCLIRKIYSMSIIGF